MHSVKNVIAAGVVVAALASGCGGSSSSSSGSSAAKGSVFSSPEWHFSMNFPSTPEQIPLNQSVAGVTINGRVFSSDAVAVSVVQIPEDQEINVDGALQGSITGAATNTKGTVTEQHAETFQGRPAREGTLQVPGGTAYVEAIVDGHRLYDITGSPRESFDDAKASFAFLP